MLNHRIALAAAILSLPHSTLAQEVSQSGLRIEATRAMVAQPARARKAMVASVHELATEAGLEILKKGGNAVDATVAVAFVLGVVHPEAGNLGGSGYLLLRTASGQVTAVDYAGTAPTGSRPGMFADAADSQVGYKSVAVPGTPGGMGLIHSKYGKLKWKDCLEPARRWAAGGFPASQRMELILKLQVPVMRKFPETARVFLHGAETPLKQDETVKQPELAATIKRMQQKGWREFYEGETARRIAGDMKASGGLITLDDLRGYHATEAEPLKVMYRGHPVLTMPPSSSGGVALGVMLNVMDRYPLELGREGSGLARHLQIEAMRRGFAARNRVMGSADERATADSVLVAAYTDRVTANLRTNRATPLGARPAATAQESPDTTHFTVIDGEGTIVTNTYTLSGFYGSQVIAKGTGVLLNNHMSVFGNVQAQKTLTPGKRYPSTMAPTIILRPDNTPMAAIGTPGGATIPSTLFQIISNLVDFKMSLRDAVEFPRLHFAGTQVEAEPAALIYDIAELLKSMGHRINAQYRSQGDVQAVMVEEKTGWRVGWSDGRRGGAVRGF